MQKAIESISSAQKAKVKIIPVTFWVIAILFGAAWAFLSILSANNKRMETPSGVLIAVAERTRSLLSKKQEKEAFCLSSNSLERNPIILHHILLRRSSLRIQLT